MPELDVANSLWVQQNFAVLPAFVRALSSEFRTGVWQVNFQTDLTGATDAINQWTSEHTKGLIKQLFSPGGLTPTTVLVLADAVFFHADWAYPFESATTNQPFYLATGATESVPFMSSEPVDSTKALRCAGVEDRQVRRGRASLRRKEAECARRDADRVLRCRSSSPRSPRPRSAGS